MSRQDFKHGLVAPNAAQRPLVFDQNRFVLNTMGDGALQVEIIGLFLAQLTQTRERLRGGPISAQDRKFLGHTLRGAAAAVGACEIEELARSWESVSFDLGVLDELFGQAEAAFLNQTQAYHS